MPVVALGEKHAKGMWMNLLKRSPLDERYCHLAMERMADLFGVSWGVQEPYAIY